MFARCVNAHARWYLRHKKLGRAINVVLAICAVVVVGLLVGPIAALVAAVVMGVPLVVWAFTWRRSAGSTA